MFCGGIFQTSVYSGGPTSQVLAAKLPFSRVRDFLDCSIDDVYKKVSSAEFYINNPYQKIIELKYIEIPDMDREMRYSLELKEKISFDEKYFVMPRRYYVGPYTKSFLSIFEIKYNLVDEEKPQDKEIHMSDHGSKGDPNFIANEKIFAHASDQIFLASEPDPGVVPQDEYIIFEEIDNTLNYLIDLFPPYDFAITIDRDFAPGHDQGILNLFIFGNSQDLIVGSKVMIYNLNAFKKPRARTFQIKRDNDHMKCLPKDIIPYFLVNEKQEIILITIIHSEFIYQYKLEISYSANIDSEGGHRKLYEWKRTYQYAYSSETKDVCEFKFFQANQYTLMQFHESASSYEEKIYLYDTQSPLEPLSSDEETMSQRDGPNETLLVNSQPLAVLSKFMSELNTSFYFLDIFELHGQYNVLVGNDFTLFTHYKIHNDSYI